LSALVPPGISEILTLVGVSEQTSAISLIVSEQTGFISTIKDGKLKQNISRSNLIFHLRHLLKKV